MTDLYSKTPVGAVWIDALGCGAPVGSSLRDTARALPDALPPEDRRVFEALRVTLRTGVTDPSLRDSEVALLDRGGAATFGDALITWLRDPHSRWAVGLGGARELVLVLRKWPDEHVEVTYRAAREALTRLPEIDGDDGWWRVQLRRWIEDCAHCETTLSREYPQEMAELRTAHATSYRLPGLPGGPGRPRRPGHELLEPGTEAWALDRHTHPRDVAAWLAAGGVLDPGTLTLVLARRDDHGGVLAAAAVELADANGLSFIARHLTAPLPVRARAVSRRRFPLTTPAGSTNQVLLRWPIELVALHLRRWPNPSDVLVTMSHPDRAHPAVAPHVRRVAGDLARGSLPFGENAGWTAVLCHPAVGTELRQEACDTLDRHLATATLKPQVRARFCESLKILAAPNRHTAALTLTGNDMSYRVGDHPRPSWDHHGWPGRLELVGATLGTELAGLPAEAVCGVLAHLPGTMTVAEVTTIVRAVLGDGR